MCYTPYLLAQVGGQGWLGARGTVPHGTANGPTCRFPAPREVGLQGRACGFLLGSLSVLMYWGTSGFDLGSVAAVGLGPAPAWWLT